MKNVIWTLCAAVMLMVLALLAAPKLSARQRQKCPCRVGQRVEGQALLSQEWARAHARPLP